METKEKSKDEGPGAEKSEKKIYKGEVKPVKDISLSSPTPVQAVLQTVPNQWGGQKVPPTFILTRFSTGYYPGRRMMHYFDTKKKVSSQVEVPEEFELNLLSGRRGGELRKEWEDLVATEFFRVSRRLSCTVGTDPEIFVTRGSEVIPAWEFLGSKKNPSHYKGEDGYKGDLYWDGFQAEFTTPDYLTCLMGLGATIHYALRGLHSLIPSGAQLSLSSVVPVDPEVLATAKDEHVAFGCAPSKNVYGLRGNTEEGRNVPYRFAGGHIHLALDAAGKERVEDIVRAMDAVLGVACVSLFADYDSPIRRKFYGQAGEYRTPAHGLEYRVLSNAWLSHPAIYHMVFDLARAAAGVVTSGFRIQDLWGTKEEETVRVIQENDVEGARRVLDENRRVFTQILYTAGSQYSSGPGQDLAWDTWTKGMGHLVAEPRNISKNWMVERGSWGLHPSRYFGGAVNQFAVIRAGKV